MGMATLSFAGWFETWDLTVEGANHYITDTGVVNCQTWIGFDECYQFDLHQYDEVCARLRSADPVLSKLLRIRAMSNPAPGWLKEMFVDPNPDGREVLIRVIRDPEKDTSRNETRVVLPAKLDDNPDKEFVLNYKFKLLGKPAQL